MKHSLIILLATFVLGIPSVASEGLRLIELAPGKRVWLTAEQVYKLSLQNHFSKGVCAGFIDVTKHPENVGRPMQSLIDFGKLEPTKQAIVNPIITLASPQPLGLRDQQIEGLGLRYYGSENGAKAAQWIQNEFTKMAAGRNDVTSALIKHDFAQPSVMVRIQGHGSHADQRVILGAHEDSIVGPGADDDGSGVASLLEIFRLLMVSGFVPDRTLEFFAYAGEEGGLLGSGEIAHEYAQRKIPVLAALQFDMTMYPKNSNLVVFMTDYTDAGLTVFVGKLAKAYTQAEVKVSRCGYGCSDHASWYRNGYPSVIPFESLMNEYNPNIHTTRDTGDKLDYNHGLPFVKIGVAYAVELANLEE